MLLNRALTGATLVGLIGLPYFLSQPSGKPPESGMTDELRGIVSPLPGPAPSDGVPQFIVPGETYYPASQVGAPIPLEQIFRFDITFEQILHTWPSVTTATNQPDLKGYRVALVTGSLPESLAGSLTYYFNKQQQLQRIVFHGTTGEPQPLVQLMTRKFGLVSERSEAATQRYQIGSGGQPTSELRVQPAQIVDASQPHRRFQVSLIIERPQTGGWFSWLLGARP